MGLAHCPQPYDRSLPAPIDMLRWNQAERIVGFRNTYRQYAGDVFHADPHAVSPLPSQPVSLNALRYEQAHRRWALRDYLQHQDVTGLLVLHNARIVYEYYGAGNTATTLWTSRSVAKSIVSVLIGIAIREGVIGSVDDAVTAYLPELRGTSWDQVSLKQLLQHTAGVRWNENYEDPRSDFARLTRCEASQDPYPCVLDLVSQLQRGDAAPGQVWSYNTGGAWLAGRVLERASGMTIAHYLETRLWRRFGMENDGVWEALRRGEVDMGGHGFNATLRDWGRFGWFVAIGGHLPDGTALLPSDWLAQSIRWTQARGSVTPANPAGQYGYQWWHMALPQGHADDQGLRTLLDRSFCAEGIFGQTIAIDPADGLVMVQWSSWPHAEMPDATYDEQALFFGALAQMLGPSTVHSAEDASASLLPAR